MALSGDELLGRAREVLGDAALDAGIVYAAPDEWPAGALVALGASSAELAHAAQIRCVDLEPAANWSHRGCYLLAPAPPWPVRRIDATMPPFLKAAGPPYHLLWRGPQAPLCGGGDAANLTPLKVGLEAETIHGTPGQVVAAGSRTGVALAPVLALR